MKNVLDNKKCWKNMKPLLSDKNTIFSQISTEKSNKIMSDDFDLLDEFSIFVEDAARLLSFNPGEYYLSDTEYLSEPVEITIKKFGNHPSVLAIK